MQPHVATVQLFNSKFAFSSSRPGDGKFIENAKQVNKKAKKEEQGGKSHECKCIIMDIFYIDV